ncbi:HAMP domain-containing protein [Micromonospora sp. PPF5-17]|uniref:histidine kinase n=1 Tax=Micromonospora solifontis TaxID=2487138 RepID=A0ABX9WDP3_9ACTN|nr:nitrate- and nitrite sensing domain-containing protein [Micromonospora solifontis]NES38171.1 HAMP domain-containing protein [Micromonospora solifontis]RNL96962.1 HAMP domain-containing protein [Micromonospora solifontis]
MRPRTTNLRAKVIALLASLVALWSFAAWVTLREGINLLGVQTIDSQIVSPSEPLLLELQVERRLSVAYLGAPTAARREALDDVRRTVDEDTAAFKDTARGWRARLASDGAAEQRVDATVVALDGLAGIRRSIDDRTLDRTSATSSYTALIDSLFQLYDVVGGLDDPEIEADTRHLIELYRVRELISQEDALLVGALAAGRITPDEHLRFTQLASGQRFAAERIRSQLRPSDQTRFNQVLTGSAFNDLRRLEDRVMSSDRRETKLAVGEPDWNRVSASALTELQEMVLDSGDDVVERAKPVAALVIVRLVLAAGLGLIAVIASIVVSVTTARALVAELQRLRDAAHQLANERLPGVVGRLARGEEVDVAREAPPLQTGDDEIGQVGKAFNAVQETAIRTAVEQAELRRSVREVFLSLARRTQALVHRQLTLLDAMERREHDAEELEDLFRVDHLATRMRRNAENLIVLSGSTPGRSWRRNVPMVDVVRGAVAEVEDYTRVTVLPLGPVSLSGRAVGDLIHLLAELIENGLSFSPPHTTVEVRGQLVANGFAIEIEDRGLGMSEEELAAANHRIVDRSELNLADAARLGLFVVSRLTERHGVKVQLKESAYGGTTAVVLIPSGLLGEDGSDPTVSGGFRAGTGVPGGPVTSSPEAGSDAAATPTTPEAGEPADPAVRPAEPARVTSSGYAPAAADPAGATTPAPAESADPTTPAPPAESADATTPAPLPVAAESADATTVEVAAEDGPATGESGLPVRVRQASLAPELRAGPSTVDADDDEQVVRPPEQVRRMMTAYQSGTRRGRTDAARLLSGAHGATGEPGAADEQAT